MNVIGYMVNYDVYTIVFVGFKVMVLFIRLHVWVGGMVSFILMVIWKVAVLGSYGFGLLWLIGLNGWELLILDW